jgi:hypothetical protein
MITLRKDGSPTVPDGGFRRRTVLNTYASAKAKNLGGRADLLRADNPSDARDFEAVYRGDTRLLPSRRSSPTA